MPAPICIRSAPLRACDPLLLGVDFTSAPSSKKPIAVARGHLRSDGVVLQGLEFQPTFQVFETMLRQPGPWLGGFDMPFGLPRELIEWFGWPDDWVQSIQTYAAMSRDQLRTMFKAFCAPRPTGSKFAHRGTDRPAGSSPSMKWVNPPVAWMLHAGAIRLIQAEVSVPGLFAADPRRIALEAYPGLSARSITTRSYKSDTRAKQTADRRVQRVLIVKALAGGQCRAGVPVTMSQALRTQLIEDGSGDSLDAVLCLMQAAWALLHPDGRYGLPLTMDPLEGWIVGAH